MGSGKSCCGVPTDSGLLGTAGCFFILFPMYASTAVGLSIAAVARRASGKEPFVQPFLEAINRVALGMINDAMTVRARCAMSGRRFSSSPRVAGALFRYLNVAMLGAAWVLLVCAVASVV